MSRPAIRTGIHHNNLRTLRQSKGLTPKDMTEHLHFTRSMLSRWENFGRQIHVRFLPGMADMLGCTIEDIVGVAMAPASRAANLSPPPRSAPATAPVDAVRVLTEVKDILHAKFGWAPEDVDILYRGGRRAA